MALHPIVFHLSRVFSFWTKMVDDIMIDLAILGKSNIGYIAPAN